MKSLLAILAVLTLSQTAFAQFGRPSLSAVKGHIETNDSELNLAQVKVVQMLECRKGWGDGERTCGIKKTEAMVNAKGDFELAGIKGESNNWREAGYQVFLGDQLLFSRQRMGVAKEKLEGLRTLLSSFTIYIIKPFKVKFTTDTGVDFAVWKKTENNNNAVGVRIMIGSIGSAGANSVRPDSTNFPVAVSENNSVITHAPQMMPGKLADIQQAVKLQYSVESRIGGLYSSQIIAEKELSLNDEDLMEKLSNVKLNTKLINYAVDGLWGVGMHISFHEGNHYFQLDGPGLLIDTKCEDGVLRGKVYLQYRKNPELDEVRDLVGTCAKGKASFDISLVGTNYSGPDRRNFDLNIRIFDIASSGAESVTTDLATKKVYPSYGGIIRCSKIVTVGNVKVCETL